MPETGTETESVNVRINTELLQSIDETWKHEGFNSRSEFIRQACRDAVRGNRLSEAALESLVVSAEQARRGEFVERGEIREEFLEDDG